MQRTACIAWHAVRWCTASPGWGADAAAAALRCDSVAIVTVATLKHCCRPLTKELCHRGHARFSHARHAMQELMSRARLEREISGTRSGNQPQPHTRTRSQCYERIAWVTGCEALMLDESFHACWLFHSGWKGDDHRRRPVADVAAACC